MPLSSGSVFASVKTYLVKAAHLSNPSPSDRDPDLNMQISEIDGAPWGSHSFRRLADRRVRDYCVRKGISLTLVDKMLGWKEAEMRRNMQEHYDEDTLLRRWEQVQATYEV